MVSSQGHHTPPTDLRRMTSSSTLLTPSHREHRLSNHTSQHLQTGSARVGSRSPSSIPSSPTSAHSSSSAIFERDIEPLGTASPPPSQIHPPNPHRIPRSKTTEQLEQNVPSVLDTAAAILTSASPMEEDQIAVVTPACERPFRPGGSGFASPNWSLRSRSPSPTGTGIRSVGACSSAAGPRTSLLLSVPGSPSAPLPPLPFPILTPSTSPKDTSLGQQQQQKLTIQTSPSALTPSMSPPKTVLNNQPHPSPSASTPTSVYYSTVSSTDGSQGSPTTTTVEQPPMPLPTTQPQSQPQSSTFFPPNLNAITTTGAFKTTAHVHSPASQHAAPPTTADLLASTPAATIPLSSFTNCSVAEPPPHIPRVSGYTGYAGCAGVAPCGRDRDAIAREGGRTGSDRGAGERESWAREGLGRGLEERLEALMSVPDRT
ncbi:hypothetical protein F5141DRAFT_1147594 [Pisolithus sp. B1]|nr:hypothetical protein F5141DRAFT_1147594 [Pisolithus sp. B1]